MNEEENKAVDYLKNDVVYWLDKGKDFVVIDIGENKKLHTLLHLIKKQQNKIEAQEMEHQYDQNMIDDLKGEMVHNWIHKDKIREKIEELENIIEFEKPTYEDCLKYTIDILEKLLKEN